MDTHCARKKAMCSCSTNILHTETLWTARLKCREVQTLQCNAEQRGCQQSAAGKVTGWVSNLHSLEENRRPPLPPPLQEKGCHVRRPFLKQGSFALSPFLCIFFGSGWIPLSVQRQKAKWRLVNAKTFAVLHLPCKANSGIDWLLNNQAVVNQPKQHFPSQLFTSVNKCLDP